MKITKIIVDVKPRTCYSCIIYTSSSKKPKCCKVKELNYTLANKSSAIDLVPGSECLLESEKQCIPTGIMVSVNGEKVIDVDTAKKLGVF